jgi:hypothetical protein
VTRQSDQVNELAAALVAFQAEMGSIPKGSVNPFFKSNYADLADCVKTASPVATKHGLAVTQHPGIGYLTTRLWHASGQWIEEDSELAISKEHDSQARGSAITYSRRYDYCATLGIVADEDDDGNAASKRKAPRYQERPAPRSDDEYETVNGDRIPLDPPMDTVRSGPPSDLATPKQANYAKALLGGAGITEDQSLSAWFRTNDLGAWPGSFNNLSKAQASGVIERLKP